MKFSISTHIVLQFEYFRKKNYILENKLFVMYVLQIRIESITVNVTSEK